jgi:hypothetical protein
MFKENFCKECKHSMFPDKYRGAVGYADFICNHPKTAEIPKDAVPYPEGTCLFMRVAVCQGNFFEDKS